MQKEMGTCKRKKNNMIPHKHNNKDEVIKIWQSCGLAKHTSGVQINKKGVGQSSSPLSCAQYAGF